MINIVKISGEDAHKFLQGLVSNDIGKLKESGDAIHTYFLTAQGKFLFEFLITKDGDDFYIVIKSEHFDVFLKKLKMYKLRSKVEIEDLTGEFEVGRLKLEEDMSFPEFSKKVLGESNLSLVDRPQFKPGAGFRIASNSGDEVFRITFKDPRFKNIVYVASNLKLQTSNFIDNKEYEKLRIENLVPEGDADMEYEGSFPMQFRMVETDSVCFKKGCYIGQEVTARTHHRGKIRKTLFKVQAEGNIENLRGEEIFVEDKKVGKLLSAIDNIALAQLEIDAVENKNSLSCGGIALFRF